MYLLWNCVYLFEPGAKLSVLIETIVWVPFYLQNVLQRWWMIQVWCIYDNCEIKRAVNKNPGFCLKYECFTIRSVKCVSLKDIVYRTWNLSGNLKLKFYEN